MIEPVSLSQGHYECRSLDATLPVLTGLLAMEVLERNTDCAMLKHPNTEWRLVVHEGGPDAATKPLANHYGFRVETTGEIEAAHEFISAHKGEYAIELVARPYDIHLAHCMYFREPGGNYLEIEFYDPAAALENTTAAPHWGTPLPESSFPGRGYVPQGLTHGTLEVDDPNVSNRFYTDVLGLHLAGGTGPATYIKHPDDLHYVVALPGRKRHYLSQASRFTLSMSSAGAVHAAHEELATANVGVTELCAVEERAGVVSFMLADPDRNWWEVTSASGATLT